MTVVPFVPRAAAAASAVRTPDGVNLAFHSIVDGLAASFYRRLIDIYCWETRRHARSAGRIADPRQARRTLERLGRVYEQECLDDSRPLLIYAYYRAFRAVSDDPRFVSLVRMLPDHLKIALTRYIADVLAGRRAFTVDFEGKTDVRT